MGNNDQKHKNEEINSPKLICPIEILEGDAAKAWEKELKEQREAYRHKKQLSVSVGKQPAKTEGLAPAPSLTERAIRVLGIPSATSSIPAIPSICHTPAYIPQQNPCLSNPMKNRKPTAYDLMEIMKREYIIRVKDQDVYFYLGTHYQRSNRQTVQRLIMHVCRDLVRDVGSGSIVDKAYSLLLIEPELAVTELTADRNLVSFQNGVLRLSDGCLLPHSPELFTTYVLACNYIPQPNSLPCPHFDRYLETATGGDQNLMLRIL